MERRSLGLLLAPLLLLQSWGAGPADWLDVEGHRRALVETARLWDGGLDGQSGLGALRGDFSGFFRSDLDRMFRQLSPTADQTLISQCRAVYFNVEAYRASLDAADRARFLSIARLGADTLLAQARDPSFGGLFWGLEADGTVPPVGSPGGSDALIKQAYGQVHAVFSLAHVFGVTGDPELLTGAMEVWRSFRQHFSDPQREGAYTASRTRDFSVVLQENNFDYMLHYFEALLALYDVTSDKDQTEVADELACVGNFMTGTLVRSPAGVQDESYVCYWYGQDWGLHPRSYDRDLYWLPSRFATAGHGIEFAWLLSRAAERGFPAAWLEVGERLLRFAVRHGVNPNTGGMLFDRLNLDGSAIPGASLESLIWWPQAETARATMHYGALRDDVWIDAYKTTAAFIDASFVDPVYGGWYAGVAVHPATLEASFWSSVPDEGPKGSVWKVNYHSTMYHTEALRLAAVHDPEQEWRLAFTTHERTAFPERTAAEADFDGDGQPNLLEFVMGEPPRRRSSPPLRIVATPGGFALRYPRARIWSGIRLQAEWSRDLVTWDPVESSQVVGTDAAGRDWLEASTDGFGNGRFFRLVVSTP